MNLTPAMGSAVSGLQAYQAALDVIGNNLANLGTPGFKAGRVEFQELLSQTLRFGTAPQGWMGGIDPLQIGTGVGITAVRSDFNPGALQVTGRAGDLAVDGGGFFILRDADGLRAYTRDGSFGVDARGILVDPSSGFAVQGLNADPVTFALPAGGALEDVRIPLGGMQMAAQTQNALFGGNLDGGGALAHMGTLLQSVQFLDNGSTPADANTALTDLWRVDGSGTLDLDLDLGDTITVNADKGGQALPERRFFVGSSLPPGYDGFGTTFGELAAFLQRSLGVDASSPLHYGAIRDNDVDPNTTGMSLTVPAVFAPSTSGTWTLTDPSIVDFGLEGVRPGDIVRFNTGAGAGQAGVVAAVALDTLTISPLGASLPLPASGDSYTIHQPAGVSIVDAASTPWLTDGALLVAGNAGLANALTSVAIANQSDNLDFGTFAQIEAASGESIRTQGVVYDSLGNARSVHFTFVLESRGAVDPLGQQQGVTWRVFVEAEDGALLALNGALLGTDPVAGGGRVVFDANGQFLLQEAADPQGFATIRLPNAGAETPLSFATDFSGLTGLASAPSTAGLAAQDGLATGVLTGYSIGADGIVTGIFSNGGTRSLAQLFLARFRNPDGLLADGANVYRENANSGTALVGRPGEQGLGSVLGGTLEASNVDLAKSFGDLIAAQRAFQANARVLSRADQMLEELVKLL
jgi:flagellar hook protein FlgE